jgi:hypothetical protein
MFDNNTTNTGWNIVRMPIVMMHVSLNKILARISHLFSSEQLQCCIPTMVARLRAGDEQMSTENVGL